MTKNLNIYVATMTGTALMVADEIEDFCKTEGINTNIVEMDALEPKNLEDINAPILIVSSTYGQGDVPDGSKNFYNNLNLNDQLQLLKQRMVIEHYRDDFHLLI